MKLKITEEYSYLGLKFKPSGSLTAASDELYSKALRAWYSISNIIYQNKRMSVKAGLRLFDSLIAPICLFSSELWSVFTIPKKSLNCLYSILKSWEGFQCEKLNHKVCNVLLSLHSKSSRLAALGEIARYPLLIQSLSHSLVYEWILRNKTSPTSWVGLALRDMDQMAADGVDCWVNRVNKIKVAMNIPNLQHFRTINEIKQSIKKGLRSKFEMFWKSEISMVKTGSDGQDHNKLRYYKTLKSSFTSEP